MTRMTWWFAGVLIAIASVGCGSKDPLAGKSEKDLQAMQAAEQKVVEDEEMAYAKERRKARTGK
jgi:hypothetical protein